MIRSTIARVDLSALRHNFAAIQQYLAAEPGQTPPAIIAVVKANAYGHGAERVALTLEQAGATMLACADIEEGIVLRRAGVRVPILVFGALSVSDLDGLFDYALTPTISTPGAARAVHAAAARRRVTMGYHLKIDTGMNRLGFRHENLPRTLPQMLASDHLRLEGVFTHFATADVPDSSVFTTQCQRFEAACGVVSETVLPAEAGSHETNLAPEAGSHETNPAPEAESHETNPAPEAESHETNLAPEAESHQTNPAPEAERHETNPPPDARGPHHPPVASAFRRKILRHACNSAALLRDSRIWYDAVRPGLLLYGIVPPPLASTIPLQPVMSLTSRVVAVKGIRPGEGVGYGWRFEAEAPRTIAVIPAGYADGLDTRLCGRGHVLIRGRRVPVVGAVSMDMITVDVTEVGEVQPGDEVVLLGRQGDESWQQIDAREVAAWIGTIPWEIVCRLGTRVERHYE